MFTKNIPFIPTPIEILESAKMTSDEKILYLSILNTYKLSFINGDAWKDTNGIFVYYSIPRIQKSIGCSRPKAIKILNLLTKNGYIVKEHQDGKSTKIYLVQNEYTEFVLKSMKEYKNNKKHKKVAPRKIAKQEEIINEVGVDEEVTITAEPEVQEPIKTITDYTADAKTADNSQSICDTFNAIIGREPDNSFKKCIAKRAAQMGLTAENMRSIITLALKARNPEAYILAIIKPNQETQTTYQPTQKAPEPAKEAPLDEYEIEWLIDIEKSKEESNKERIQELEQMLAVIEQKKAEQEAQKPLEQWEIEYISEIKAYEAKENMLSFNTSAIPPEVRC